MERRTPRFEGDTPKEATPEQAAAAHVGFYLTLHKRLGREAKEYANGVAKEKGLNKKERRNLKKNVTTALLDLYAIKDNSLSMEPFEQKWGNESQKLSDLLEPHKTILEETKSAYEAAAPTYSPAKRIAVAANAARVLRGLEGEQKERLFELAGYSEDEGWSMTKKIARAGGWSLGLGTASVGIVAGTGVVEKMTHFGGLSDISDTKTQVLLGLSYGLHYSAAILNGHVNHSLLKDQEINNAPNVFATSLYFLLKKFVPENKAAHYAGVQAGTIGPIAWQEIGFLSSLAIPGAAEIVFARNAAGVAINASQAVVFKYSDTVRKHI